MTQFEPRALTSASSSTFYPLSQNPTPTPVATPLATPTPSNQAITAAQLAATWQSACSLNGGNSSTSRVTFNANGTFSDTSLGYASNNCSGGSVITIAGSGTYTIGGASTVAGATNVMINITQVIGTPPNATAALGLNIIAFCNYTQWAAGVPYSIPVNNACLSDVPQGAQIIGLANNGMTLYFGNASNTALDTTVPLTKQ